MITAWLIESENCAYIWVNNECYSTPRFGWTFDHSKALRFSRKEDADAFISAMAQVGLALHESAKGATEHGWHEGQV